jgi:hypothetical protein
LRRLQRTGISVPLIDNLCVIQLSPGTIANGNRRRTEPQDS